MARAFTKPKPAKRSTTKLIDTIVETENSPKERIFLANHEKRDKYDPYYHEVYIRFQGHVVCVYCGQPATGLDHMPALSKFEEYVKVRVKNNEPLKALKVSCCGECNSLLSNTVTISFKHRLDTVRMRLKKKYYKAFHPTDRANLGRLARRLNFTRGINRIGEKYDHPHNPV